MKILRTICVSGRMYKSATTVVVFSDIMSKSIYRHFVQLFGLTVSLRVIRRSGEVLDAKEAAYFYEKLKYKLHFAIREEEGKISHGTIH